MSPHELHSSKLLLYQTGITLGEVVVVLCGGKKGSDFGTDYHSNKQSFSSVQVITITSATENN